MYIQKSSTPDSRQSLNSCLFQKYYRYNSALISWGLKGAELPDFNKKQQIPFRFDSKHFTPWEEHMQVYIHTDTHAQTHSSRKQQF